MAFANCMHGYDRSRNVHANGVTRTRKFVHGIDYSVQKLFESANPPHSPLCFKKIKTNTALLTSNTVVQNICSHSTAFDPQSFAPLP